MDHIAIICSLEVLPSYGDGKQWFGLALSVGCVVGKEVDPTPAMKAWLKPWEWKIDRVKLQLGENGSMPVPVVKPPGTDHTPYPGFLSSLACRYSEISSQPDLLEWTPPRHGSPVPVPTPSSAVKDGKAAYPWPAFLSQVSRHPYPLPHSINLALLFHIRRKLADCYPFFSAAPILRVDGLEARPEPSAEATWPCNVGVAQSPAIRAYVNRAYPPKKVTGEVVDRTTLRMKLSEPEDDWRSDIDLRVGQAFDVAERAIELLETCQVVKPSYYLYLRDLVVWLLRWQANPGHKPRRDGTSVVSEVVRLYQEHNAALKDAPGAISAIAKVLDTKFMAWNPQGWKALLRKNLARFDATGALAPCLNEDETLDDVVRDLRVIKAQLEAGDTLSKVVAAVWHDALDQLPSHHTRDIAADAAADAVRDVLTYAPTALPEVSLKPLLMQSAVPAAAWSRIADTKNVWEALRPLLEGEFKNVQGDRGGAVQRLLVGHVAKWFCKNDPLGGAVSGRSRDIRTRTAHPVSFRIADLKPPSDDDQEKPDIARLVRGVAFLMRDTKVADERWHCLNMVQARFEDGSTTGSLLATLPIIDEVGPHPHAALRQSLVTYDNQPLVAQSPLAKIADRCPVAPNRGMTESFAPLLTFEASSDKLCALKYRPEEGAYQVFGFALSNTGALPKGLADPQYPARPRPALCPEDDILRFDYRRRVPIGPLRFPPWCNPEKGGTGGLFHVPREGVTLRARSIPLACLQGTSNLEGDGDRPVLFLVPDDVRMRLPSRLRAETASRREFLMVKPAVDISTWDRWLAVCPTKASTRKTMWARHFREGGVTLEDPAVRDEVTVALFKVELDGGLTQKGEGNVMVTFPGEERGIGVAVDAGAKPEEWLLKPRAHNAVSAVVPQGEIGLLRLKLVVSDPDRFEKGVLDSTTPIAAEFLIEVATAELPTAQAIRDATAHRWDPKEWSVDVRSSDPAFRHVVRAELLRQPWRWDGRPAPSLTECLPLDDGVPKRELVDADQDGLARISELREWEAVTFGERWNTDHSVVSMTPVGGLPAGTYGFVHKQRIDVQLAAEYLRTRVRVISRYEGLLDASTRTCETGVPRSVTDRVPLPSKVEWNRLVIPCRWAAPVPKPAVKLVLPLTETGPRQKVPGVLVVMNERWYEVGGLAERLEVELMRDRVPDTEKGADLRLGPEWPQFGPDPILSGDGLPRGTYTIDPGDVIGPVGHTFDRSTYSPLFVGTSFVIPMPDADVPLEDDGSWYFAKLRFRRVLDPRLSLCHLYSEFTRAYWVQYLPDFGKLLDRTADRNGFDVVDRTVRLSAAPTPHPHGMVRALVLTKPVLDALGRTGQEAYVATLTEASPGVFKSSPEQRVDLAAIPDLRARILQIQTDPRHPSIDSSTDLWKEYLFPPEGDAHGRIVGVSAPMNRKKP